jgi:hypothetical protein
MRLEIVLIDEIINQLLSVVRGTLKAQKVSMSQMAVLKTSSILCKLFVALCSTAFAIQYRCLIQDDYTNVLIKR